MVIFSNNENASSLDSSFLKRRVYYNDSEVDDVDDVVDVDDGDSRRMFCWCCYDYCSFSQAMLFPSQERDAIKIIITIITKINFNIFLNILFLHHFSQHSDIYWW